MSAGKTVSIRVPEGVPEELKAATGLHFSTVVRYIVMAVLAHYRAQRLSSEGKRVQDQAKLDIQSITEAELLKGLPSDD